MIYVELFFLLFLTLISDHFPSLSAPCHACLLQKMEEQWRLLPGAWWGRGCQEAAPRLRPGHSPPCNQEPLGGWGGLTVPVGGQEEREEEEGCCFAPPRLFVPCLWRWVLQELRNTTWDQDGKHFFASAPGKSEPQRVCVSRHCHKNIHAFVNTLWLFLFRSIPQSDLPHGHAKAWISTAKGHLQPEARGWGKMAQTCFHGHTSALNDHQRAEGSPCFSRDCGSSPKISLHKNKTKQTAPFFLLLWKQVINQKALLIKYLGLNFSDDWNVLETNSSTSWELKKPPTLTF